MSIKRNIINSTIITITLLGLHYYTSALAYNWEWHCIFLCTHRSLCCRPSRKLSPIGQTQTPNKAHFPRLFTVFIYLFKTK